MTQNEHNLLLDVKGLTRSYPLSPKILMQNFDFRLYKKDFALLTGKSGSGKTTFLKFIIGMIKPPIRTMYHKKEDIARYSDAELQLYKRNIGVVFQDDKLLDHLTVYENIVYPLRLYGLSDSIIQKKATQIIQKLHLQSLMENPVAFLSCGEKKKVGIARALIHDPECVVADEPTGNLDREQAQMIADILLEINAMGHTVLLATHDIHLIHYIESKKKVTQFSM